MKTRNWQFRFGSLIVSLVATLTLASFAALAKPRAPLPPSPEASLLFLARFDNLTSNQQERVHVQDFQTNGLCLHNGLLVASWSGYALDLPANAGAYCCAPALSPPRKQFTLPGSVRLWVMPRHTGGAIFEACELAQNPRAGFLLYLDPAGAALHLAAYGAGQSAELLAAPVDWRQPGASAWHQVGVNYSAEATALFVDGQCVATGPGLGPLDQIVGLDQWALFLGGNHAGQGAGVLLDEVAVFSRPCAPEQFAWNYFAQSPAAVLGPVTEQEELARAQRLFRSQSGLMALSAPPAPSPGTNGGGGSSLVYTNLASTNALRFAYLDVDTNTVVFKLAWGTNGSATNLFDVYAGTNLFGTLVGFDTNGVRVLTNLYTAQWFWLTNAQLNQFVTSSVVASTNFPQLFLVAASDYDQDGGGLPNAFELLISHTAADNAADDALVGLSVPDPIAMENTADTARFVLTRLCTNLDFPLTIPFTLSGTATFDTDYTLSNIATNGANKVITIPAGATNAEIILTANNDTNVEGAETVGLTLATNWAHCPVATGQQQATALILNGYDYVRTYTSNADFSLGVLSGLRAISNHLEFDTNLQTQFPFINVACTDRGTVVRINTTNGHIVGEYRTAPLNREPSPSRTTVDQYGNVWVANRYDDLNMGLVNNGSITRIGLIIGTCCTTNESGGFVEDPNGQYVRIADAIYNTCIDRDGDGYIKTSRGQADILPWSGVRGEESNVDDQGGVSTAEDEAITEYVRVRCTGTRTVAIDKFNDIWVGGVGEEHAHLKVNGLTGMPITNSIFYPNAGGYGGVIDGQGNLWSSAGQGDILGFRLVPPANFPVTSNDWAELLTGDSTKDGRFYGIAIDPLRPLVWQTSYDYNFLVCWNLDGTACTNSGGDVLAYPHGNWIAKGLAVDAMGDVWVAHSDSTNVGHLNSNGSWVGNVSLQGRGMRVEYFANTNCDGLATMTATNGSINFDWGTNSPAPSLIPCDNFSARWKGLLFAEVPGTNTLYISTEASAAFALKIDGQTVIDNWTAQLPGANETNIAVSLPSNTPTVLELDYIHFTGQAHVKLSWKKPGATTTNVIPWGQFLGPNVGYSPTGVSIDQAGKVWAANLSSGNVMRINPSGGPLKTNDGIVTHLGEVDMQVSLGDPFYYPEGYQGYPNPYNYSDMTGFNNRVVNPSRLPLKGYWKFIQQGPNDGERWQMISWNASGTNGGDIQVFARASDNRETLPNSSFRLIPNGTILTNLAGRYIEVRLAVTRPTAACLPTLDDLTLCGTMP